MTGTTLNKSYFFDEEPGWGNRSYFTFFSEFNRSWSGYAYIEATIYLILFFISMFVNVLIFYQIVKTKSIRTVTNYFICNLALADIFFTLTSPLIAVQRIVETWALGRFLCHVMVFDMFVSGFVIIWTMTMISIDRYICINRPSSKKITPKMAIMFIAIIWVVGLSLFSPIAIYFVLRKFPLGSGTVEICTLVWPVSKFRVSIFFTTTLCLVGFLIPLTILGIDYFLILKRFCRSRRTINSIKSTKLNKRKREIRDFKVIQTLVLVVVLFMLMWLPIFVVFVLIQTDGMGDKMKIHSHTFIAALAIILCNACVNPFIYGIRNYRIKRAVIKCLTCRKRKRRINPNNEPKPNQTVFAVSYSMNSTSVV